jgi:hypothetical protein
LVSESAQEYRHRAEECERLMANAQNAEVRRALLYLAKRWREFAAEAAGAAVAAQPKVAASDTPQPPPE